MDASSSSSSSRKYQGSKQGSPPPRGFARAGGWSEQELWIERWSWSRRRGWLLSESAPCSGARSRGRVIVGEYLAQVRRCCIVACKPPPTRTRFSALSCSRGSHSSTVSGQVSGAALWGLEPGLASGTVQGWGRLTLRSCVRGLLHEGIHTCCFAAVSGFFFFYLGFFW